MTEENGLYWFAVASRAAAIDRVSSPFATTEEFLNMKASLVCLLI